MSEWISVKDRLPEPVNGDKWTYTKRVLVWEEDPGDQYVATLWRNPEGKALHWEYADACALTPDEVTHWRPLPEPPTN